MRLLTSKLVLGVSALVVILVVVLVVVLATGGDDEAAEEKNNVGPVAANDLRVGDCVTDALTTQGDVTTFDAVSCNERHDGEVYTLIVLKGTRYPGEVFVTAKGQRGCRARLRRQATRKAFRDRQLGYKFVYPTQASWADGDREIVCLATWRKPRTGRLRQREQRQ